MRRMEVAVDAPRDRLTDRPAPCALTIEPELTGQPIEPLQHGPPAVAELERTDDRRDRELTLADERLRIDYEPRLAPCGENVVRVEILIQEHLLALGRTKLLEDRDRGLEQALFEGLPDPLPSGADRARPPGGLVGKRPERRSAGFHRRGRRSTKTSSALSLSGAPGRQRSSKSAWRSSSRARSRTAPSPCQTSSASASCSLSRCGHCILSTTSSAGTTCEANPPAN